MQNSFDTFENAEELNEMIDMLQKKTAEYMKLPNAWEFLIPEDEKLTCK